MTISRNGRIFRSVNINIWIVLPIAGLALSGSAVAKGPSGSDICGRVAPSNYFLNYERPRLLASVSSWDSAPPVDSTRLISPLRTSTMYSDAELNCWNGRGDPLAGYMLALRYAGATDAVDLMSDPSRTLPAKSINLLLSASHQRACGNYLNVEQKSLLGCKSGLAEAQYILGMCFQYGRGCGVDLSAARSWYDLSANNGYYPAKVKLHSLATGN